MVGILVVTVLALVLRPPLVFVVVFVVVAKVVIRVVVVVEVVVVIVVVVVVVVAVAVVVVVGGAVVVVVVVLVVIVVVELDGCTGKGSKHMRVMLPVFRLSTVTSPSSLRRSMVRLNCNTFWWNSGFPKNCNLFLTFMRW